MRVEIGFSVLFSIQIIDFLWTGLVWEETQSTVKTGFLNYFAFSNTFQFLQMELEKRHAEEIRKYQFKENQLKENLKKATSEKVCHLTFYSKQIQLIR